MSRFEDDMSSDERLGKLQNDGVLGRCFGFDYDDEQDVKSHTVAQAAKQDLDRVTLALTFAAGMVTGALSLLLAAYFFYGGY
jgi:hypothetical protein